MNRRKHHAACIVGDQMIIHGGIDQNGDVLYDILAYDIELHDYRAFEYNKKLGPLAGHSFVVVNTDEKQTNL